MSANKFTDEFKRDAVAQVVDRSGPGAAVGGEVIQDHHIALVQGRGQLGFDVKVE